MTGCSLIGCSLMGCSLFSDIVVRVKRVLMGQKGI
ncbi:MAG: hypothetical protein IKX59_11435 [Bacteroidales bacterium]|nr:hypothetical protein [Bacteroidales bacterium]